MATTYPTAADAECEALGAMLADPETARELADAVPIEAFSDPRHQAIYDALCDLVERGEPTDPIAVHHELRQRGRIERAGGVAYLESIVPEIPDLVGARHHLGLVQEAHARRLLSHLGRELVDSDRSAAELVAHVQQRLAGVEIQAHDEEVRPIAAAIDDVLRIIHERHTTGKGDPRAVLTGLAPLDERLIIAPGTMTIVAGDPGSGKSALALQIAEQVAAGGQPVLLASYEMSGPQLAYRSLAARVAPVPRLQRGQLTREEQKALGTAGATVAELPIWTLEASGCTVAHLAMHARRLRARVGLGLVVVDYLQLVPPTTRGRSREQEVSEVSHGLRALALSLDVPVIALSQLRRREGNRTPALHDLRESGALEQDADAVVLLSPEDDDQVGLAVVKNRQGPTGRLRVAWDGSRLRFRAHRDGGGR